MSESAYHHDQALTKLEYHPPVPNDINSAIKLVSGNQRLFGIEDTLVGDLIKHVHPDNSTIIQVEDMPQVMPTMWKAIVSVSRSWGDKFHQRLARKTIEETLTLGSNIFFANKYKPSEHFSKLILEDARKSVAEGREDTINSTGGEHFQIKLLERGEDIPSLLKQSVKSATLAILENISEWHPEASMRKIAQELSKKFQVDHDIKPPEGGYGFSKCVLKTITTDQNNDPIYNLLDLDLAGKGLDAIKVRVFSSKGDSYQEVSVVEFLKSENLNYFLKRTHQIKDLAKNDRNVLIAIGQSGLPTSANDPLYRYIGNRGGVPYSFIIASYGISDKLLLAKSSHVPVNGVEAKAVFDLAVSKLKRETGRHKFGPSYLVLPDIGPKEKELEWLAMSDVLTFHRFSDVQMEKLKDNLGKINQVIDDGRSDRDYQTAMKDTGDQDVAKIVRDLLNPRVGLHTMFGLVLESVAPTVFVLTTKLQPQRELAISMIKSLPKGLSKHIADTITDLKSKMDVIYPNFEKYFEKIVGKNGSLLTTQKHHSVSSFGWSVLGYIQGFVNHQRWLAEFGAKILTPKINRKLHPAFMISNLGKGQADFFATSQNQSSDFNCMYGLINDAVVARFNCSVPNQFKRLDLGKEVPEQIMVDIKDKLSWTDQDLKKIREAQEMWKRVKGKLKRYYKLAKGSKNEPDLRDGLQKLIITKAYVFTERSMAQTVVLSTNIASNIKTENNQAPKG